MLDFNSLSRQDFNVFPAPNTSKGSACKICHGQVDGIYLMPLSFDHLEKAVALRKTEVTRDTNRAVTVQNKDDEAASVHAEATYLLLSNSRSSLSGSGLSDREQQRTGRWTDEEIAFVDYLVSAFDKGKLPLPHGIKLNEFLGDILICKSSRLTKKMKNAKLSTRSFALGSGLLNEQNDFSLLSNLQEKFLMSIPTEATQLELRFNLTKQWRTHFSNLCVQVGYPFLDGKDWVASLEELERRASEAEDMIRRVRRRRMGLALQTDGGSSANPSVFIAGVKADKVTSQPNTVLSSLGMTVENPTQSQARKLSASDEGSDAGDEDVFAMLDGFAADERAESQQDKRGRGRTFSEEFLQPESKKPRSFSEDFDLVLSDLMDPEPAPTSTSAQEGSKSASRSCGPFLDAIIMYMENRRLPFQHADVWVPSFLPRQAGGPSQAVDIEQLRLFHAGHATRGDLDGSVSISFHEFGVYSDNFSFEPGHGLPGRVYTSGQISWETNIDESDPKIFERAGGAKVYGVKTAVGIPLSTPLVGRIVVAMYSKDVVPENMVIARECARELMRYSPEPKWKLVIEMNDDPHKKADTKQQIQPIKRPSGVYGNVQVGIEQSSSPPQGVPTQLVGCTSPTGTQQSTMDSEEQRIVTLLGEHMPLSDGSAGEPSSSAGTATNLLPHFMAIRLLLLRPNARRSSQENEMIDVLKNSFRAYAKDNRRSGAELANLLAKDWICLKGTYALTGSNTEKQQIIPARRRSSTDAALVKAHTQLMQAQSNKPMAGPMLNPPGQFLNSLARQGGK